MLFLELKGAQVSFSSTDTQTTRQNTIINKTARGESMCALGKLEEVLTYSVDQQRLNIL